MEEKAKYKTANNKKDLDTSGRVQPQAVDLEEGVLGACLLEKEAMLTVIDILKPEVFYSDRHAIIFDVVLKLFNDGQPVDILTASQKLKETGELENIGGPYYLTQLTNRVASAANVEVHARIILQKYYARELIRVSAMTQAEAYEDSMDIFELIAGTEAGIMAITECSMSKRVESAEKLTKEVTKQIFEIYKHKDRLTGIPTGYTALDRITGGWQKSDLIIIAGRPGMGKTTFALNCAIYCTRHKCKAAMFSLEMSDMQLVKKIIAQETNIELSKLNIGDLDNREVDLLHDYQNYGIPDLWIDDTPAISTTELRAKAIRLKAKSDIHLIIVDYLQLMIASGLTNKETREREISKISQSLKALAKELNIPVIALSQLSRQVENRGGGHRPILSDLRESGSIENDADVVIFCYRPEYYKIDSIEHRGRTYGSAGIALLDIAKGRNIGTGEVLLNFSGKFSSFKDYDEFFVPDENPETMEEQEIINPFK
jgi:replicative DNA helicase